MPNYYNPNFNSQVTMVYTEEPGFTGYKGFDFNKIDEIESILKSSKIGLEPTAYNENVSISGDWASLKNQNARVVTLFNTSPHDLEIKQIPVEGGTPYVFNSYNPASFVLNTNVKGSWHTVKKTFNGESFFQNNSKTQRALIYSRLTENFNKSNFTINFKFKATLLNEFNNPGGGSLSTMGDAITFFIFSKWSSSPTPDSLPVGSYSNDPDNDAYRISFDVANNNMTISHGSSPVSSTARNNLPLYGSAGGIGQFALSSPLKWNAIPSNFLSLKADTWKDVSITFNNGQILVSLAEVGATFATQMTYNDPFYFKRNLSGKYFGILTDQSLYRDSFWRIKDFELNGLDIAPVNKSLAANLASVPAIKLETNMGLELKGISNANQIFLRKISNSTLSNITYRWEM